VNHGTEFAYAKHKCRCDVCVAYKSAKNRAYRESHPKPRRRKPDDGIVDEVVVERLLARRMSWRDATMRERVAAAYAAWGRDGWYVFCEQVLALRSERVTQIAHEMRQAVAS